MDDRPSNIITFGDSTERDRRKHLLDLFRNCPVPDDEILANIGLFVVPSTLSRISISDIVRLDRAF